MKQADLAALTVADLKTLAKKIKIVFAAGAKKTDIIKALLRATASAGAKPKKAAVKKQAAKKPAVKAAAKKTAAKKAAAKKAAAAKPKTRTASGAKTSVKGKPQTKKAAGAAVLTGKPAAGPAVVREWQRAGITDQERVAGAKYFTGPGNGGTVTPSLPATYGDERMVIMSRDPFVLFGYWEVSQERLDRERARFGTGARLCVRIYDITGVSFDGSNATATFDQEVFDRAGSWYFHLARPSHRFCADIGLLASDGRFRVLNRSNTVSMPQETVSDRVDEAWMISDEAFLKLHGLSHGIGGVSSAQIQEVLRAARMHEISSHGLFSPQGQKQKRK